MSTALIFSFFLAFSFSTPARAACPPPKTVILISVDGLGDHLLNELQLPEIERLAKDGIKAPQVTTTDLMKTLPGHTSMLTGLSPDRHGITHNDLDDTLRPIAVPTLFGLLKDHAMKSAAVVGKRKIAYIIGPTGVDSIIQPESALLGDYYGRLPSLIDEGVKKELTAKPGEPPAFVFVHYALGDTMGHIFQWESWPQRWGLRAIDRSIGRLRADADAILGEGQYVILLTADHGGHGGSHGQRSKDGKAEDLKRDFYIPWILYGMPMEFTRDAITINDTAPTIAALLGLTIPKDWDWQGQASARLKCSTQ